MISEYVMCDKEIKISNFIHLWFQVMFYSIIITIIFIIFKSEYVGIKEILSSIFPTMSNAYWYFSSYCGMFLLLSFINEWIYRTEKRQLKKLFLIIVIVESITVIMQSDPFGVKWEATIWLCILYILGAYIKKYVDINNISLKKW